MKNMIEFYYNIKIKELQNTKDIYYFKANNNTFIFKPYQNNPDIIESQYRLSNTLKLNNIIPNKYNSPLTIIDNIPYILIKNIHYQNISLQAISNISNTRVNYEIIKNLERNNWETLWSNKIDYYESQIRENKKKYPLIRESFDYFIGMGEIAISYLVNTKLEVKPTIYDTKVPSHNTIYTSLYDPSNIILDHKARDIAEYIKYSFWNNNYNIFIELNEYFKHNIFSIYGIRVLYSRILYPSFYFDLYDQIITERKEEKELNKIITKISQYEYYLNNIYIYFKNYYDIPEIPFITKKRS